MLAARCAAQSRKSLAYSMRRITARPPAIIMKAGMATSSTYSPEQEEAFDEDSQSDPFEIERKPHKLIPRRASLSYGVRPSERSGHLTQREKAGLGFESLSPSSPDRYWPKYDIEDAATKFECDNEKLTKGPFTVGWTPRFLFIQDKRSDLGRRALKPSTVRDNCECVKCRDPISGQKTFSSTEINPSIGIADVRESDEGLVVKFTRDIERLGGEEEHETLVSWTSLEFALQRTTMEDATLPRKRSIMRRTGALYWDREVLAQHVRKFDYEEYMKDDSKVFWDVVIDILRMGIVFLKNVPRDPDSVTRIATRIANIRETFYGHTFDVRAKPNAENVAYTSGYLGLHQDLLYLEPPPMIQVLHTMENSCKGGESLFSDGERVGRLLYPYLTSSRLAPLCDHYVPYHYVKNGYSYFSSRHLIETNEGGFANVWWSPPFQGQYLSPTKDLRSWLRPARLFESLINDKDAIYKYKMEEGECVLFDNLRVMHGRTAFTGVEEGGSRWLRGTYIAGEDFLSRAAHIPRGQAERLRGPQIWTPKLAQKNLWWSDWNKDVSEKVERLDSFVGKHKHYIFKKMGTQGREKRLAARKALEGSEVDPSEGTISESPTSTTEEHR